MIFNSVYYYFIIFGIALGISIGIISAYMTIKKWSMFGDIISHAALPGMVLCFLITQSIALPILIFGGFLSSLLSISFSFYLEKYNNFPKDTSFALLLSWFFSIGIIAFNIIQKKGIIGQSILNSFIFGNILMINHNHVYYYIIYSIILFLIMYYTKKKQEYFAFDQIFSKIKYKYVFFWELLFLIISILTIVIALQSIGILLIGGLIILPGNTARLFCNSYTSLFWWSIIFSVLIFLSGISLTFYFTYLPTGPICLLCASLLFFSVFLFQKIKNKI
jgi:manganese/zinc/iron transport system permease protein